MNRLCGFLLVSAVSVGVDAAEFSPTAPPPSAWAGHVSYVAGYKQFESDWAPVEGQFEFGVFDIDVQPPKWPVSLCTQLLVTYADSPPDLPGAFGDYSGAWEINLGVRKVFPVSQPISLFLGGGVSFLGASSSSWLDFGWGGGQVYEDSDSTVGFWCSGGVYWNLSRHFHLGLELQYSQGEITLFHQELSAGGFHALGMFGYHW